VLSARSAVRAVPSFPQQDGLLTMTNAVLEVIGGVDTHADCHVLAILDELGRLISVQSYPSDSNGCHELLAALTAAGPVRAVGIEGTGSYGAGLARLLTAHEVQVVEVDRPNRKARRSRGKSDPVDAEAAARAVLAGTATGIPKTRTGPVEAIRALRSTRSSAVKARTAALNALVGEARCAIEPVAQQLQSTSTRTLLRAVLNLDLTGQRADPAVATRIALARLARRIQHLDTEIRDADADLRALTKQTAPDLCAAMGVGPEVAGQLLMTAGDNPHRIRNDAAFANLTGVAPLQASSGRTARHRLSRSGDRQANRALHTVVLSRMRHDQRTRNYVARRTAQGLSKREIMRCLKRYVARELLPLIHAAAT
jgi:transposase